MTNYIRIILFMSLLAPYLYQLYQIIDDHQQYPTTIDLRTEGHGTLKYPAISMCITNWIDRAKFEQRYPDVDLEGANWMEEVDKIIRRDGNLGEIAIESETHFQFGVSNPTFYFVEFYLKKTSILMSYSNLPTYMCFSLNWTDETAMQVVHQNPLIFKSSLLFFWVPESVLQMSPYQMTVSFHDVAGSTAGERAGIILEPSGEYVFNLEQSVIEYLPAPYDTMCTDYMSQPKQKQLQSILTKPLCFQDCKNKILIEKCGCVSEDYSVRHMLNESTCVNNIDCQNKLDGFIRAKCDKLCGKPCISLNYDSKQAYSKVFDPEEEGEYYIKLVLLMTSRNVDVMQFIPALNWTKVLGLAGGYLGLWLGLSLVSIFNEIFFYMCKIVIRQLKRDYFSILAVNCIYKILKLLVTCLCVYCCFFSISLDTADYLQYRTSVVYEHLNITELEFPALTICNNQAINFSKICWEYDGQECKTNDPEAILGNRLTLVKELIKYSYPLAELLLACQMEFQDFTCVPFDCLDQWKIQYTYLKTGVCYSYDPSSLEEYRSCAEPWKYMMKVRLFTMSGKDVALSGFLHQQNTFTSGMPNTFMLRGGKTYMVTASQTTYTALELPYETDCTDYVRMTRKYNYTDEVIQAEECSERCLSNKWETTCNCYPKLYGARDRLNGSLCEYLSHLRCIQEMKDHEWLPYCQQVCTRPCKEIRYNTLSATIGNVEDAVKSQNDETIVYVKMGNLRAQKISNLARITGSDLFTLLSGHVGMWLGISMTMLYGLLKYVQKSKK